MDRFDKFVGFFKERYTDLERKYLGWRSREKKVDLLGLHPAVTIVGTAFLAVALGTLSGGVLLSALKSLNIILKLDTMVGTAWMFTAAAVAYLLLTSNLLKVVRVEVFHGTIITWLGYPIRSWYLAAGLQHWLPGFLGFFPSESPVGKTVLVTQDPEHHQQVLDLGHYTDAEALGSVFLGERLFQTVLSVQALDKVAVILAANFISQVMDPYAWKRVRNPFGTALERFEAGLRASVSLFNATDVNDIQSALPTLMLGGSILTARVAKKEGEYERGDVVRHTQTSEPILEKFAYGKKVTEEAKDTFLARLNADAASATKPRGGFTMKDLVVLNLEESLGHSIQVDLKRIGGVVVNVTIADVTLPKEVEDAAASIPAARRKQISRLTEAETLRQAAEIAQRAVATSEAGAQIALAQDGKAVYVIGQGNNPIAQLIGGLRQ